LLYSYSDVAKLKYFIEQKEGDERRIANQHLDAIVRYAEDEINCRRKPLLQYFGETYAAAKCDNCDNCNAEPPTLEDITVPAQKFLSCVKRTGERFGAGMVADVLLGSKAEKVLKYEHDKLSTYGIGKELTQKQWMALARQLVQMGYLNQDGEYRTLSLTSKATESLKKRTKIYGPLQEREARASQKANKAGLEYNHAMFALLRAKRKELADEAGVPPYVIFSDRTLVEMAAFYPQSRESLLAISGVGQVKLRSYGEAFLSVIKPYCEKHKLVEKRKAERRERSPAGNPKGVLREGPGEGKDKISMRTTLVAEAYNEGQSVESLMERYQVTAGTIVDHLMRYVSAGNMLRNGSDLPALTSTSPDQQQSIFAAFDELGTALLKPVFEKLEGKVNYDELKLLRLIYSTDQTKV
jgi:ATP-dependent DNA helicase RecQ